MLIGGGRVGVFYLEERIDFRGALTTDEIEEIVRRGSVDTLQTNVLPLDLPTMQRLNEEYFSKFPNTELRIYTYGDCDLRSLHVMDNVRNLSVETSKEILGIEEIYSLSGIRHLCIEASKIQDKEFLFKIPESVETLYLEVSSMSFDLKPLSRFAELKVLGLRKCNKNIECISELKQVHSLKLHGITLPSCSFLNQLPRLQNLAVSGGNTEDFSELYGNPTITGLYLFHLPKLNNLGILANLPNLKVAEVCQLKNIQELPDLSKSKLQHLCLENMKSLLDFSPLQFAPCLKSVAETVCPSSVTTDCILPIMQNPEVEQCAFFTSSAKKNKELEELSNQYHKKWQANAYIVREIIFSDGRM